MFRGVIATLVTTVMVGAASAQDLTPLRPWIPEDINALAVVRAGELLKTPMAARESWQHSGSENFLGGAVHLPPDCELFVRGTRFRAASGDTWSVALLSFSRPVDMQRVAEQEQSSLQTVASKPAVLSRRNSFFAELGPQLLGVISPAHRQDLSRWIERSERKHDTTLTRYLDEVLLGQSAGVTLAIDLTDMFEPGRLRERLPTMAAMIGRQQHVDQTAAQIMTVRGLRLDIYVTDELRAALTLDFKEPVGNDPNLMKGILLEAMDDMGVGLDSFHDSQAVADGNAVRIAAAFSAEDLRRVMTLVLTPHPVQAPPSTPVAPPPATVKTPPPASSPPSPNVVAPRPAPRVTTDNNAKYFRAIDQILKDLTRANRNANDYARTATWHDRFADKIANLSTMAVDPDLISYGSSVASKLRSLGASLRGVAVDVNTLNNAVVYNTKVNPGWEQVGWWTYGYQPATWETTSNLATIREQQAAAISAGAKDRDSIWQMINDERQRTMDLMTRKYGSTFAEGIRGK
ncbi:hypothetical protein Pan44_03070 [Caulifigura coniformis]|uniref:Uncharacterized protein n=1 Tax=Caulifigura coniformis TaxID=2527983 RepID=A0A517S838_9PLAN|nr:hypothetical protein [Caulifigura coniformis]QDT52298.1 hypothetical protein Pan44_03070 [Caulifigura coniformis]